MTDYDLNGVMYMTKATDSIEAQACYTLALAAKTQAAMLEWLTTANAALKARIDALEAAQQLPVTWATLEAEEVQAEANYRAQQPAPEPSAEVKTIPVAEWELTQERVGNAVNALCAIRRCAELDQPASRMFDLAREALDRDTEFEIALGM